jgi:tetratricopeptide (TPR) repeat protein
VILAGTAGIGKTRLALEVARVAEREGRVVWFRCDRYHEAVSFWPVRSAVLALVGLTETDRDARAATRVQRMLEQERPATAAALTRALGLDRGYTHAPEVDPRRAHSDALDGMAALVRSLAADEPVLLVVEDLQFADPSTTELVERLAAAAHRGLLIVVTMRNEGQVETVSQFGHCVELQPLDYAESAQLLELMDPTRTIDAGQRDRLIEVAGGIPLFLKALVSERARTDVAGIRRSLLPHSAVPVALQQPILARIEGARVDSSVTKSAAVVGNRFSLDVLGAVTGWSLEDLRDAMAELCRLELIVPAGNDVYEFFHPLIRDLAYDMLMAESRARLHSSTADALAENQDSDAAVLAFHYEHGGRFAEAIDAGLRAGTAARDSGAYREAETVLTRTIALLNAGQGGAERDRELLVAHRLRGFFRVATSPDVYRAGDEDYHASIELLRRQDPGPEILWTLAGQWADAMYRGLLDDAVEMLDLFRSVARASAPEALPANTAGYGIVATLRADYREAKRLLGEALEQIDREGWPDSLVRNWTTPDYPPVSIRAHLYPVLTMLGDTSAARRIASEAEEIASGLPWPVGPFATAYTKAYQAAALGVMGDGAAVMALGSAIQQIGSERGLEFWEKLGLLNVAVGGAQMFPSDMTISALEMTLDALKASGSEALLLPYVSNAAATAMLATGEYDRALAVLDEGIISGRSKGICCYEPESLRLRAEALDRLGRDGRPDLDAAIQLAREQHAVLYELRALLDLERRELAPDEYRRCREGIAKLLADVPDDSELVEVVRARELIVA